MKQEIRKKIAPEGLRCNCGVRATADTDAVEGFAPLTVRVTKVHGRFFIVTPGQGTCADRLAKISRELWKVFSQKRKTLPMVVFCKYFNNDGDTLHSHNNNHAAKIQELYEKISPDK